MLMASSLNHKQRLKKLVATQAAPVSQVKSSSSVMVGPIEMTEIGL